MSGMPSADLDSWLASVRVEDAVWRLRPDYVAVLVAATGLRPGPSDATSEEVLAAAEAAAAQLLGDGPAEAVPHIAAWREAFRGFGAKPQRTRNSAEALLRRVPAGLPRIDRLTDAYNAVSIATATPLGGEDLAAYHGPMRLVRASGTEDFAVLAAGAPVVEHPEPGEVVWRDDAGVTCRRWNWRQCVRTRLTEESTSAIFIADVLDVAPGDSWGRAEDVRDELLAVLARISPGAAVRSRLLAGPR